MEKGFVSSIQSLGTLDGPGIRYVVFLQGCPLRCGCCHNPETWEFGKGEQYTSDEILQNLLKYKEYFGELGGITLSGGEPIMQSEFATEVFKKCKQNGINTCLDTSGCILNESVKELLEYTDYVMLDIKYATDEYYQKYVGVSIDKSLEFLKYLESKCKRVRIRQVIIPSLNDTEKDIEKLKQILKPFSCVEKIELLPFKKICQTKYNELKIDFPFKDIPSADTKKVKQLQQKVNI